MMSNLEKWVNAILNEDAANISIGSVRTLQFIRQEFIRLQNENNELKAGQSTQQPQESAWVSVDELKEIKFDGVWFSHPKTNTYMDCTKVIIELINFKEPIKSDNTEMIFKQDIPYESCPREISAIKNKWLSMMTKVIEKWQSDKTKLESYKICANE